MSILQMLEVGSAYIFEICSDATEQSFVLPLAAWPGKEQKLTVLLQWPQRT